MRWKYQHEVQKTFIIKLGQNLRIVDYKKGTNGTKQDTKKERNFVGVKLEEMQNDLFTYSWNI